MKHTQKGSLLTEAILETFKLNGLLVTKGDQLIKELGLTSARWKVLGALSSRKNAMTVPDIARTMGLSRQAVQRLVNGLIDDEMLKTVDNPKHQKAKLLCLTAKGDDILNKVMNRQIPWANSIAQEIPEENLHTFITTLKYLNDYLGE